MERMSREARRAHWREVMEAWGESGLSKAAFCRERGIGQPLFYYWQRRLREAASPVGEGFARVEPMNEVSSGVRLRLVSGMVLEVAPDFDEATLARVLRVVGGC